MRNPLTIPLLSLLLLLAACSADTGSETPDGGDAVALVSLVGARQQSIAESIRLYGRVEAGPSATQTLLTPLQSRLLGIRLPVGSQIKAGEIIVDLAPGPDAMLALQLAQSEADNAGQAFERATRLRGDGLNSDADVETARTARARAGATLDSLRERHKKLQLSASRDGYVKTVAAQVGDLLPEGFSLVTVVSGAAARLHFDLDPALAARLVPGTVLSLLTGPESTVPELTVASVSPQADPALGLVAVYANLPPGAALKAGQSISASAHVAAQAQALVVPRAALLDDGGQSFVYVVENGVASRHDVLTGVSDETMVAIVSGVQAGDLVVSAGGTALEDGMQVRQQ
ncbi:MAG: efflux RND transporter periplasmic adaptor subunit [Pseudomonadales bacterium]|nr:efflux RND transporter periplasmic adaptor subunit [Pseudomonadales bacterium]